MSWNIASCECGSQQERTLKGPCSNVIIPALGPNDPADPTVLEVSLREKLLCRIFGKPQEEDHNIDTVILE